MKDIIAIASPSFCKNSHVRALAIKTFHPHAQIIFSDAAQELSGKELVAFLQDAKLAIVGKETFNDEVFAQLPRLKAISKYGVGLDNIDLEAAKKHGIRVYWRAGVNADSTAEHAMGLMLAVFRNIARSDRLFHEGTWWKNGGVQLTGKRIGVLGFGAVGSRVASLLRAFRCSVLVHEIDMQKDNAIRVAGCEKVSFEELLSESAAITLHIPLTPSTRHLIKAEQFSQMKQGAIFINTSRGEVVDQEALKAALMNGTLAGAGIDVFEEEPVKDRELFKIQNLTATAHMAGNSQEAVLAMGCAAIDGLREFLFNRHH